MKNFQFTLTHTDKKKEAVSEVVSIYVTCPCWRIHNDHVTDGARTHNRAAFMPQTAQPENVSSVKRKYI